MDMANRAPSMLEQSEQAVIDLEELNRNAASRKTSWRNPKEWAQRVTRLGIERIGILPKNPNEIS